MITNNCIYNLSIFFYEQLAEEMGDKVFFSKVDVDANQETAAKFGIMSIQQCLLRKMDKL